MDLGENFPCLAVEDLAMPLAFYRQLDFTLAEDHRPDNWAVLQHNHRVLCLYQEHIEQNLINFRGGDIPAIAKQLKARGLVFEADAKRHEDGAWSASIPDSDGNCIFFNTFPDERETYEREGSLIDHSPRSSQ